MKEQLNEPHKTIHGRTRLPVSDSPVLSWGRVEPEGAGRPKAPASTQGESLGSKHSRLAGRLIGQQGLGAGKVI